MKAILGINYHFSDSNSTHVRYFRKTVCERERDCGEPGLPPDSRVFTTPSLGLAVSISINTQAVHFSGVTRVVRETAVQAEVQRC